MLAETPVPQIEHASGTVGGIQDIVEALDTGRKTSGNIHLARRSQDMIFGIIASHRAGGARIAFPFKDRNFYVGRQDW